MFNDLTKDESLMNENKQEGIAFTLLIAKLDELVSRNISYLSGVKEVVDFVKSHNGISKEVPAEAGGGFELYLNGKQVSVFQPYPDIDRIYYEH